MFRPMRRASRAIPEEAAKHLLQQSRRGVLAVNGDNGYPFAIPVNYYYDQEHDKIYFHGAKSGQKVDALKQNDKVCFTAILNSQIIPDKFTAAFESVVAFGKASFIDDGDEKLTALRTFIERFSPDHQEAGERIIHAAYEKTQIIRIDVEQMTGKAYRPGNKWD